MYIGLGQIRTSVLDPNKQFVLSGRAAPTSGGTSTSSVVPSVVRLDQPVRPLTLSTIRVLPKPLALMPGVKTLTPTAGGGTVVDFRSQVAAAKDPLRPSGAMPGPSGGSGGGTAPSTEDAFTQACRAEGGSMHGNVCTLPDGAMIAWEGGRPACKNVVGRCAQGGGKATLMLGAAALAALMFLR